LGVLCNDLIFLLGSVVLFERFKKSPLAFFATKEKHFEQCYFNAMEQSEQSDFKEHIVPLQQGGQ
jgi:hypothetical protein